jgi:hypothetical protein
MKLELNTIARLNNDEKYIILNQITVDNKNYFLTMGIIKDNEIDSSKVVILEELQDEEGYFVEKVIDSDLLLKLTKLFKDQM